MAGLGNVETATFSLEGTATVSSRCYTKSGNKPQAANKQETISVNQTETFAVRRTRFRWHFAVTWSDEQPPSRDAGECRHGRCLQAASPKRESAD